MSAKKKVLWEDTAAVPSREAVIKEIIATTEGGKDIQIKRDNTGLWYTEFAGGGELPPKLKQKWVRRVDAAEAVRDYVDNG